MVCYITELSYMNNNSYADYLISQGDRVLELGGVYWMMYHGALIPATAMPVYIDISFAEASQVLKEMRGVFLRYVSAPLPTSKDWWNIVCRQYEFNNVSSNTRSKIRRGIQRHEIMRVKPEWLSKQGYECHVKCYQRYKHALPKSKQAFESFINSLYGQSIFDIWVCLKNGKLQGYILCLVENNGVFMHTIDITPEGLRDYASYAMIHEILKYYLNEKGLPVSNGSRSIAHETNIQNFLLKLGFSREYAELHIVYRSDVRLAVYLLYPFREVIKIFNRFPLIHKISSVLFQEEIIRRQTASKIRS